MVELDAYIGTLAMYGVHLQGWDLGGFIEFEPCFLKRTSGIGQPCRHYVGHVVTSNNYLSA